MSIGRTFIGILVLATSIGIFAQTTETKPTDAGSSEATRGHSETTPAPSMGGKAADQAEILTDTMGVNFGPYVTQVKKIIRQNWYNMMPPSVYPPVFKQGKVAIEFSVLKDGTVSGMKVHASSGDVALDRAAWGSISASGPFPPLPTEFPGQQIGLRIYYYYNLEPAVGVSLGSIGSSPSSAADPEQLRKLFTEASQAYGRRDYPTAVALARRMMTMSPKAKQVRLILGMSLLGLNQLDDARAAVEDEIKIDPASPYAYNDLGRIYWRQHKYEDAIAQLQKQITINPQDHDAHQSVGIILRDQKRCREAMPYLETALAMSPSNPTTLLAHGECNIDLGNTAKGISEMEQATSASSTSTWNNAAYYLADHNVELDRAQVWAETAITIRSAQLRNISLEHLTPTQLELVSGIASDWDTMGWIYFKKGDIDQARAYIEAAWPLRPLPIIGNHLGHVYEKLNRQDDAIRTYAMTVGAADLPTRATTHPEAVTEATERLTKLAPHGANIPDMIKRGREDLEAMRSISVTNVPKSSGSADFTMKVAANMTTEVRQVSGDASFSKFVEALREVRIPMQIPEAAGIEIPRRGTLTCAVEQSKCYFTLLRAEEAFDLAGKEAGSVASKLTE